MKTLCSLLTRNHLILLWQRFFQPDAKIKLLWKRNESAKKYIFCLVPGFFILYIFSILRGLVNKHLLDISSSV